MPEALLVDSRIIFWAVESPLFDDADQFFSLIGKLIYLIVERANISLLLGYRAIFMHESREVHWTNEL